MESSVELEDSELSSIEVPSAFSKLEISVSSSSIAESDGTGKSSKLGGKTRGSFFSTKNSSVEFCFCPVRHRLTLPHVSAKDVIKKRIHLWFLDQTFQINSTGGLLNHDSF